MKKDRIPKLYQISACSWIIWHNRETRVSSRYWATRVFNRPVLQESLAGFLRRHEHDEYHIIKQTEEEYIGKVWNPLYFEYSWIKVRLMS